MSFSINNNPMLLLLLFLFTDEKTEAQEVE